MNSNFLALGILNKLTTNNVFIDTLLSIMLFYIVPYISNYNLSSINICYLLNNRKHIILEGKTSINKYGIYRHDFSIQFKAVIWHLNNMKFKNDITQMKEVSTSDFYDTIKDERSVNGDLIVCQYKEFEIHNGIKCMISIDNTANNEIKTVNKNITINLFHRKDLNIILKFLKNIEHEYLVYIHSSLNKQLYFCLKEEKESETDRLICNEYKFESTTTFNTIFFEEKDYVLESLNFFLKSKEFYEEKGLPYRFTLFLHGSPGCGKTSIIKSIANYTKRHIINIRLNHMKKSDFDCLFYQDQINNYVIDNSKRIYVIEEFDVNNVKSIEERNNNTENVLSNTISKSIAESIKLINNDPHEVKSMSLNKKDSDRIINLSDILQALDGLLEQSGRIMIITTNNINKIDKAILRPGRMDVTINLKKANYKTILQIYKNILGNTISNNVKVKLKKIPEYKYSPAELSNLFFYYKNDINKVFSVLN